MTPTQAAFARNAFRDFGKGRHPRLPELRDRFSYALAAETGEPLLGKGDDFRQSGIEIVELPDGGD